MGDPGSIPGWGRSPGEGKSYPLQYSGLENSMDCIAHGVAKSRTRLSDFHFHSLHRMQSVPLQCTVHGFKYIHRCAVVFRTFSSLHKETSIPPPLSPHPIPFAATSLPSALSISCSGRSLQMESDTCGLLWTLLLLNLKAHPRGSLAQGFILF